MALGLIMVSGAAVVVALIAIYKAILAILNKDLWRLVWSILGVAPLVAISIGWQMEDPYDTLLGYVFAFTFGLIFFAVGDPREFEPEQNKLRRRH